MSDPLLDFLEAADPALKAREIAQAFSPADRATLIIELLRAFSLPEGHELNAADKLLALIMAEKLGHEKAQWLYHFSVLCTRLV